MDLVALQTKRFFACPECHKGEYFIEHLIEDAYKKKQVIKAGPWFCGLCGYGFTLQVDLLDGHPSRAIARVAPHAERRYKEWVIIDIPPQTEPIRLVVNNTRSQPTITEEHIDHLRFRFEENTSLGNIFLNVEGVKNELNINPKLIKVCTTNDEVDQVIYGEDG